MMKSGMAKRYIKKEGYLSQTANLY